MYNEQLDPKNPAHLRRDPVVQAWIEDYQKRLFQRPPECLSCGWPHNQNLVCGMGAAFGKVELGGNVYFIDTSNVAFMREYVDELSARGFHWRDQVYVRRDGGDVVISHIETYNNCPQDKEWRIPVNEFASIVCAASVGGESAERYAQVLALLGDVHQQECGK